MPVVFSTWFVTYSETFPDVIWLVNSVFCCSVAGWEGVALGS